MFGAQTATQSQRKYQDSMKGNPNSGVKCKAQKSLKVQIEEDKVIEAHVTHWQELENQIRVQHWQEKMAPIHNVREGSKSEEDQDHNFHHGAKQDQDSQIHASEQSAAVSGLAGVSR